MTVAERVQAMEREETLKAQLEHVRAQRDAAVAGLRAVLMFHGGWLWTAARAEAWLALTGKSEATTRSLCDFVREQMAKVNGDDLARGEQAERDELERTGARGEGAL